MSRRVLYHPESDCLFGGVLTRDMAEQGVSEVDPTALRAGTRIATTFYHSTVLPSLDFETYSEAGFSIKDKVRGVGAQGKGGLPVVGTPVYVEHPSAEVLSLAYDLKDGKGRRLWVQGTPDPADLLDHVRAGGLLAAWNSTFEWWVWNMVAVRKLGWPFLPLEQLRCDMAKARRYNLPAGLDNAAKVLGTPQKDAEGKRLIQKLTRPHTPTKNRPAHRWTPSTAWPDFAKLYAYNVGDVLAEDCAAALIPDLTPDELATWQLDQRINARGVQVDVQTLDAALEVLGQAERKYTLMLCELTGGAVSSASAVAALGDWLAEQGCRMSDMQADTVRARIAKLRVALGLDEPPAASHPVDGQIYAELAALPNARGCLTALEIRESLGSANVKKLRSIKLQTSSDGRLRDQYKYCGADRTGRAAAGGVQLQNITAKGPKVSFCAGCSRPYGTEVGTSCPRCGSADTVREKEWTIRDVRQAIEDVRTASLDHVEATWGAPLAVLCGILRGLFVAAPGKVLICADFSAIEAVAAACLSRCQWRIEVFSTHGKIYEASAANATGISFEEILAYKREHGTHHPARKGVGKIRELAGGYGGWINAWRAFGADDYFADDAAIKADVLKWREESPEIVHMWGGQYVHCGPGKWDYRHELHGLEGAAIAAIQNPGQTYGYNDISYAVRDDVLFCRLPSGRFLQYHRPRLTAVADKLNRGPAVAISFEGWNSNATKGPVGWVRMETFGGRLFENVVQAVCADIQFEALRRCEAEGYATVMHTHDEGCAEVPDTDGYSVERMEAIMGERPAWASWWPLGAAGWRDYRYQKD